MSKYATVIIFCISMYQIVQLSTHAPMAMPLWCEETWLIPELRIHGRSSLVRVGSIRTDITKCVSVLPFCTSKCKIVQLASLSAFQGEKVCNSHYFQHFKASKCVTFVTFYTSKCQNMQLSTLSAFQCIKLCNCRPTYPWPCFCGARKNDWFRNSGPTAVTR